MSAISPTTRRWMSPPPRYDTPHIARDGSSTTLTPYLTLPYILSLTWLAYPIISLLFVALRLAISSGSAQDSVADAKTNLLASCAAAEKAATTAASLPRYMAVGTNKMIAASINLTMNAARATLVLSLTIMEAIINFVIDIYRSTFLCFVELVVRGGLAILISAVQEINDFLSSTFSTIRTSIQDSISSINSAIQTAIDGINDVNPFSDISAPQFDVPDLSILDNVTLPDSVQQALTNLNSTLPTVDQIKDTINDFINTPFEELKADINNTFAGLDYDSQALFVPEQQTLSFCNDMDTSVVDDLGRDLVKITKIGIILLVVLALLLLAAHCALEWYKWRCLQQHLEYTRQAWVTDPTMNNAVRNGEAPTMRMTNHNLLILAGSQQHPLLTRISNQLAALLKLTPAQHTNLQWFFHYVFHPPVLAVFLIGFLGLLSVQIQLLAIRPIEDRYSAQVASSVSDFSNTIATSMNASMYNQSSFYANQINTQVNSTQTTINDGLFGWVNGTTTTLNTTLNDFYSDVQNAISTVFNGTVLEDSMQEFIYCLIGSKVEAIETALTFLHDNLVINIPTMNESALVLSQQQVDEASAPIAAAAVGDGTDDNQGLVGKVVARYVESLKKERLMFAIFIALWGLVVVIAILIILWHSYVKPRLDEKKRTKFKNEHREFASFVTPYKSDAAPAPAYTDSSTVVTEKNIAGVGAGAGEKTFKPGGFFKFNLRSRTTNRSTTYPHEHHLQHSWDSLLDSTAERDANKSKEESSGPSRLMMNIGKSRKLKAIGSKAGRERFVSDEERAREREREAAAAVAGDDDSNEGGGWMKRLTNAFSFRGKSTGEDESRKNADDNDSDSWGATQSSASGLGKRKRPNLTIRTSLSNQAFAKISRNRLPTASENVPPPSTTRPTAAGARIGLGNQTPTQQGSQAPRVQNYPPSAWSVSPDSPIPRTPKPPKTLPWLQMQNPASTAGKRMNRVKSHKPRIYRHRPGSPASPRPVDAQHPAGPGGGGLFSPLSAGGAGAAGIRAFPMPATPRAAATVTPAAQLQTPFTAQTTQTSQSGVPSYYYNYSSSLPHYAGRESLLPENPFSDPRKGHGAEGHRRTSSVPLQNVSSGIETTAPLRTRARHGSVTTPIAPVAGGNLAPSKPGEVEDPFRTPFDDDARVIPENWPQPPTSKGNIGAGVGPRNPKSPTTPGAGTYSANPFSPRAF
ncbi:hypothetical protein A7U60_g4378 [Sanghuangporus baumii]|uniref:Plasma membrane fusion protein PRM1 n=1 Tax=Sanghuangporus baumii TaxID=108892 RepID=A0A9Q5N5C1_SANBA|nr:hypothetical protein A7U60_g4378 [Sanghuangporus baumii]